MVFTSSGWSPIKFKILSTFSDKIIKATIIFDMRLLRRRFVGRGSGRDATFAGSCRGLGRRGDCGGAPVRPAPAQQDAVLPPPVPPHALRAPAAADAAEKPSSIPLPLSGRRRGAVAVPAVRRARLRHPFPLLPVVKVARWQNLIPSCPWIAPVWRAWGRNPRKGRDQILQRSVAEP